jgi:hypothetical protein
VSDISPAQLWGEGEKEMMEDERENLDFKVNLANIELAIRALYKERRIDGKTFSDFMFQARTAMAMDELRQLARDLAELSKSKNQRNL